MFLSMTLPKFLTMCYCVSRLKNIPPYRMIRGSDIRDMKGGIQKLSLMNKLVKNVEKGVRIVNLPHLMIHNWTSRSAFDTYNAVKHLFTFPSLKKRRRLEKIAWKTYYNILFARKGYLVGEQVPKNKLKEDISYQKAFFSCITIVVYIFILSLKQNITGLPAMVSVYPRPVFWVVS